MFASTWEYEEYMHKTLAVSIMKVPAVLVRAWHAQMPFAQYVSDSDKSDSDAQAAPLSRSPSPPCSDEEERMDGVINSWA